MIGVLVVDDNAMVRAGVTAALDSAGDIAVVGECIDGSTVLAAAHRLHPEVVVMDVSMPVLGGVEATEQLNRSLPDVRVVMFSASVDGRLVRRARAAGAVGYLHKASDPSALIDAVRVTAGGGQAWDSQAQEALRHG